MVNIINNTRLPLIEFSGVNKFNTPYRYFCVNKFFNPKFSEELLGFLEGTTQFVSAKGDFYEQTMFPFTNQVMPTNLVDLLSIENTEIIRKNAEFAFETRFQENFIITAHRLLPGQETKIHNDYLEKPEQYKYGFTHRIIVYLNRTWSNKDGGLLGIYSTNNYDDLVTRIEPIHNTAVGLAFGPNSYHDVGKVIQGERYTVNFSFMSLKI